MSDELHLNGKQYVSSKKAAETTGYTRDYIGQLARGGSIDAERVGGLWYVSLGSLADYEKNAESARALTPAPQTKDADSALTFEGKDYISASRASKLSGYNQDYVGQLARGKKIPSRQIGNRWYVDRDALLAHKAEKDALLAAVQAEAVGLIDQPAPIPSPVQVPAMPPSVRYMRENADLIPHIPEKRPVTRFPTSNLSEIRPRSIAPRVQNGPASQLPASSVPLSAAAPTPLERQLSAKSAIKTSKRFVKGAVAALTIILVLSVGLTAARHTQVFAGLGNTGSLEAMSAAAAESSNRIGDLIENIVSPELKYESDTR